MSGDLKVAHPGVGGFAAIGEDQDGSPGVAMMDHRKDFPHGHRQVEFLKQLPLQGGSRGLIGFELASRKFPQAAVPHAGRTLGDQDPALVTNDCGGNNQWLHGNAGVAGQASCFLADGIGPSWYKSRFRVMPDGGVQ